MSWPCLKQARLFCLRSHLFTASQIPSPPWLTQWSAASSIQSDCPARAHTAGAMTRRNHPANIEDRGLARAMVDRVWIQAARLVGADAALRYRRALKLSERAGD